VVIAAGNGGLGVCLLAGLIGVGAKNYFFELPPYALES
jgi:hypothetical protein